MALGVPGHGGSASETVRVGAGLGLEGAPFPPFLCTDCARGPVCSLLDFRGPQASTNSPEWRRVRNRGRFCRSQGSGLLVSRMEAPDCLLAAEVTSLG